jgi:hypothetical protein
MNINSKHFGVSQPKTYSQNFKLPSQNFKVPCRNYNANSAKDCLPDETFKAD